MAINPSNRGLYGLKPTEMDVLSCLCEADPGSGAVSYRGGVCGNRIHERPLVFGLNEWRRVYTSTLFRGKLNPSLYFEGKVTLRIVNFMLALAKLQIAPEQSEYNSD